VDARVTTAELIAFIELQEGPRRAIEESRCRRLGASAGTYDARWSFLGCHARRQCSDLRFSGSRSNGSNRICNDTSGALDGGAGKIVETGISHELAYLVEVVSHRFPPE
jgi:hypothetical protein